MSRWAHITACISFETEMVMKKPELKKYIQTRLNEGPKITGSEHNADIFVNIQGGYNWYVSRDCEHCKYRDELINVDDTEICHHANNRNCARDYQTCVIISIQGDLRDRTDEETKAEFEKFKSYLETFGYIRDYAVNIKGE